MRSRRLSVHVLEALFVLSFTGISTTSAQTFSFGQAVLPAGTQPLSIATGDFNGDGKLDLAVANGTDNTVSVFLGKPDGSFSPRIDYPTGPQPSSVTIGDFNGDGNLDIAVASQNCFVIAHISTITCGQASVSILLGNGDGTFQPHQDFPTATRPFSVATADLNGDGKLDLVLAGDLSNSVSVLLGNGDGTFQSHVDYPVPSPGGGPYWAIVADFNADGKPDVAAGYGDGSVAIYLGNGDGTLQGPQTLQLRDSFGANSGAAAGDFNGDGKIDIAVTSSSGANIFLGNGDGTFTFLNVVASGDGPVTAIDLNKDGRLDLIVVGTDSLHGTSGAVYALVGNGDGTFQPTSAEATGVWPYSVVVGDFNGDGAVDFAVTVLNVNYVSLPPCPNCPTPSPPPPGYIALFLGLGNGTFGGSPLISTVGTTNSLPVSMKAVDLNGDGKLDLVFANSGQSGSSLDNTVSVLLGNGDGTFQTEQNFATGVFPVALQVVDLNGDGKADLTVVSQVCKVTSTSCAPGSVSVLLGNGDGTFQPHSDFGVGVTPMSLAIADFNGDGKPDLAVTNANLGLGNTVSILTGKGNGTFNPHVDYTVVNEPGPIVAADFNHDGKIDLAVACEDLANTEVCPSPLSLSILLGNGDATFQRHDFLTTAAFPHGPSSLAVGDFNGDTSVDLVAGDLTGSGFSVFLGKGDGTFQPGGTGAGSGVGADFFALGDFYGDGNLDVALAEETPRVVIFHGNGDGTFQPAQILQLPVDQNFSDPVPVSGDFNGDGNLDLAVVQPGSNNLSIFLNEPFTAVFPTSLAFGSQGLGTSSMVQAVNIANPNAAPFTISNITIGGAYSQTNNCLTKLLPGKVCTINVTFVPVTAGASNGSLTLTNTTRSSPQVIPLTGTGVSGGFLEASQTHLTLSSTSVGSTSTSKVVTLTNTGNAMASVTNIGITGANSGDFSQTNTCAGTLTPENGCAVSVTFTPTAGGTRLAMLAVTGGVPGNSPVIILSGISENPQVSLSPSALMFSAQVAGTTSTSQSVTLSNTGTAVLNITQISASGDFAETNTCGTSLAIAGNCQITVTFTPTVGGSRTGFLTIADGASGSPQSLALTGTGQDFTVTPNGVATTTVATGQTATYALSLTPSGGFGGSVTLTCSGAPAMASCSVSPATVTLSGTTATTATVTVTTTAASQVFLPGGTDAFRRIGRPPMMLAAWLLTVLALFSLYRARGNQRLRWAPTVAMALLVFAGLELASCGGGNSSGGGGGGGGTGTEAGTYTITVSASATAGSTTLSHATKFTLVVQ
jgi:hypothetical protein